MKQQIQFLGAAGEVTGSCHLLSAGKFRILLDCGLIQGGRVEEARNRKPFPFDVGDIDAVVLSHAHLDHSGRLPLLVSQGYQGPIFTHAATADLCRIMLRDAAFINEKEAQWENRKRERKGMALVEPLYTQQHADAVQPLFQTLGYGERREILPGVEMRLNDAGHILGAAIVELWLNTGGDPHKLVFSGDLGRSGMPVLRDPEILTEADAVVLESTYGDRLHRGWQETIDEIREVFAEALDHGRGNILIPAFAVGRTQEILYLFAKYFDDWGLGRWRIFLDSPLAIEASQAYARHKNLFDQESRALWEQHENEPLLPNLTFTRRAEESMQLNRITSGAVIIAGSGMCNGGRIKHHLKHNIWRKGCQLVITGYQARGTPGRALVDGARHIRLWGEAIKVAARIHTIGGLSAHADQAALLGWYRHFEQRPPVLLVHGEEAAQAGLAQRLRELPVSQVEVPALGDTYDIIGRRLQRMNRPPDRDERQRA